MNELEYRGKKFTIPTLTKGIEIFPQKNLLPLPDKEYNEIYKSLNKVFNLNNFIDIHQPFSLGLVPEAYRSEFMKPTVSVLDLPIKFPGSRGFRLPNELKQFSPVVQLIASFERDINDDCYDEYYCYLTVDQDLVRPDTLHREAPCHVDGFQGARWNPKVKGNHTYTVSNTLPTKYYLQRFKTDHLDEKVHDFFWDFNNQVARNNSAFAWQPKDWEITLMDCYSVHRGVEATEPVFRTWIRLSFEVRIFDRLGNAHNPMFSYDWKMVPRDIEELGLIAYHTDCDPSLRVFPWQNPDGSPRTDGFKTKPILFKEEK